jgi:hypothetical protein
VALRLDFADQIESTMRVKNMPLPCLSHQDLTFRSGAETPRRWMGSLAL